MTNLFDTEISIVEIAIEAECGKSHILPTHKLNDYIKKEGGWVVFKSTIIVSNPPLGKYQAQFLNPISC